MNVCSVTLSTFLCVMVVSALPPTHQQPLDDLSQKFQCASDTAIELINDAELENELQEFKRAVEISIKEFELCKKKTNGTDILLLKCQVDAMKAFLDAREEFFGELATKQLELAKEIRKEVSKCFRKRDLLQQIEQPLSAGLKPELFLSSMECAKKIAENTIDDTQLATIYYQYKPFLQEKLDELKICIRKDEHDECGTKKAIEILHVVEETVESMRETDYDTTEKLVKDIDRKCF